MANNNFDELVSVGVDIGKDVFHLVGFDKSGQLVLRKKIKRMALVATFEELPHCIVGMEACMSAHFVSRTLRKLGFEPRIIPAIYVQPFNKGQKNDYNDAEAIAEAALRPNLKTVSEKTQEQLDLQALHRGRDFAAWLGLVPRQHSTGGRTILGRITKRGSRSLRMLFVQAAQVIMMRPKNWHKFSFGPWLEAAATRMQHNKLGVALANKLARIAWSVLNSGKDFDWKEKEFATAI